MLRCLATRLAPVSLAVAKSTMMPLEALTQIQLGITPPLSVQRGFMLEHCTVQLQQRGITEAKLVAMDSRLCTQLMKRLVLEQYLCVPFRVLSFDMEFTGPPVFTSEGPTEDITEMGLYSPARDETFSCLVRPACGRKQGPGVAELTHISNEMLEKEGIPFTEAWEQLLDFLGQPEPGEVPGAERRILLLSHGGKLADVSLMKWTLEKFDLTLPSSFTFGDTIHLIRDAHRRRPVTVDKHPPSWKLLDLVQWLKIPPTLPAHRAGNDAKMTWDALYHTLRRYGDDEMTPREQLVTRFFDEEAKELMRERQSLCRGGIHSSLASGGISSLAGVDPFASSGGDDVFLAADASPVGLSVRASGHSAVGGGGSARTPSDGSDALDLDFDDVFKEPLTSATDAASLAVEDTAVGLPLQDNVATSDSEGGEHGSLPPVSRSQKTKASTKKAPSGWRKKPKSPPITGSERRLSI